MESCGLKCLKYTMFLFNLLFFLSGVALLAVGIWVLVDGKSFMNVVASNPIVFNAVYIIIAVGAALLVIAFFGCCGAIKENRCLLGTYFFIVLVIFIVEIVGGILAFAFYPRVQALAIDSMNSYNESDNANIVTDGWDTLQAVFQCCGFNSYYNWGNSTWTSSISGQMFPLSCCVRDLNNKDAQIVDQAGCMSANPGTFYDLGCEAKVRKYYWAVGGTCLGILFIELLAMIFTCCLYRSVDSEV